MQGKSALEAGRIKPGGDSYVRATRNISCWEQKVAEYKRFEEEVQAIETRNRNDAARALREKAEYYKNTVHPRVGQLRCG
ncbi:hypothetical protein [Paraflavitalea speifideaquila]|uniref:hypothetical protein n=1 Tax=Paraflavitalea speifideaquila TaxID=3076558 RepID=UPI0028ED1EAC|nr:hypothetical protein [Paraflavitalea speifideiaquila]